MLVTSCGNDIDDEGGSSIVSGNVVAFSVNLKQDWNTLNAQTKSPAKLAAENYTVATDWQLNGKPVSLQVTTLNGILAPQSRMLREKPVETRGTQVNDVAHFPNTMGVLAYPMQGGSINKPSFLYDMELTKEDNLWTAPLDKHWPEGSTMRFYLYAPYQGKGVSLSPSSKTGAPTISYVTPSEVTGQQDIMVNDNLLEVSAQPDKNPLNVEFRHILAAVRFRLGNSVRDCTIKEIKLQGVKYKGTYDWASNSWTLDDEITDFSISPNQSTAGQGGKFVGTAEQVFLLPPQALGENVKAVITVEYQDGGSTVERSMSANLYSQGLVHQWEQSHTTTYTISAIQSVDYHFEVVEDALTYDLNGKNNGSDNANLPFTVVSYKQVDGGAKAPVAWNVTGYSYDNGTTWTTTRPAWLTFSDGYSGGTVITEEHPADVEARDEKTEFSKRQPVSDYDLSTHNFNYEEVKRNTANCYIVNRPGSYKLPLVYGNAIKNGLTNEVAYHPAADSRFPKLYSDRIDTKVFLNHLDNPITDPWIKNNAGCTPTGGEVVWQDVENLVTNVHKTGDYLCFDVDADHLKAGNSIIAVTDGAGTILWSWHIWVTDKCAYKTWPSYYKDSYFSNSAYYEPFDPVTQTCDFDKEQLLLGCLGQTSVDFETRQVLVRYEQEETGETDVIQFNQEGQQALIPEYSGMPMYYQWGRKDPMLHLNDEGTANATTYNATRDWRVEQVGTSDSDPRISIGTSIQNPNVMYVAKSKNNAWRNVFYENNRMCNLWNSINRKFITCKRGDNGSEGVGWPGLCEFEKSIYDPSPVGYHIADPLFFFMQAPYTDQAAGRGLLSYLNVNGSLNGTIYKAAGWRRSSTGNVGGSAYFATWTSVISHEDISLALGIEYCTPYVWYSTSTDSTYKWGAFVTISSDFGSSFGCPVIPIKDVDWPEGWDFQP